MHEPLFERIRVLEAAVTRWQLVSLALMLLVVSLVAIGGTFGLIFLFTHDLDRQRDMEMMQMERAEREREEEQRAREQAQRAVHAAEDARRQMQHKGKEPPIEGDVQKAPDERGEIQR